jgi:hypothetical protein
MDYQSGLSRIFPNFSCTFKNICGGHNAGKAQLAAAEHLGDIHLLQTDYCGFDVVGEV